jgi:hypothetical protein
MSALIVWLLLAGGLSNAAATTEPVWQSLGTAPSGDLNSIDLSTATVNAGERRFWVKSMGNKDPATGKSPPSKYRHWIVDCRRSLLSMDSAGEDSGFARWNRRRNQSFPAA